MDPGLNAYYNWPGFFILSALVTRLTGLASMVGLVKWAPVYFNVLYLGPLLMMLNAATRDKRLVWLGVWFFYLTNWIDQDYYSPQALNYFFSLVILGLVLKYFGATGDRRPATGDRRPATGVRGVRMSAASEGTGATLSPGRVGLMAILMALYVVSVFSHQLTPFATVAGVIPLVVFNRSSARSLPLFMMVALATWISFMAAPYLAGHAQHLVSGVGSVQGTVSANLLSRLHGSAQHAFIVHMRLLFTAVVWGLAALGAVRCLRRAVLDLRYLLLALAPFPLMAMQAYGGEMLLRIFLFSLPAMVFLMAALFYPRTSSGRSWGHPVVVSLTSLFLLGGFLFARYGNERMDYIAASDVSAVQHLYRIAKPGSVLLALSSDLPWQSQDIERYKYATITQLHPTPAEQLLEQDDISAVLHTMQYSYGSRPVYLIITHSQKAALEVFNGFPPGLVNHLQHQLVTSRSLRVIYDNGEAQILVLAHPKPPWHARRFQRGRLRLRSARRPATAVAWQRTPTAVG